MRNDLLKVEALLPLQSLLDEAQLLALDQSPQI
jgi:hypothetical protein